MAPRDMQYSEILTATKLLAEGPHAAFFRASAAGSIFAHEFDVLRGQLASGPSESAESDRLTLAIEAEDATNDQAVRFGDGALALYANEHWDPTVRADAAELRATLFPDGLSLVNKSYAEEAGRGAVRDALLTPEVRAKLARFPLPATPGGPANLEEWMIQHLQESSTRLSNLLEARGRQQHAEAPRPLALVEAKRGFIRLMKQLLKTFDRMKPRMTEPEKQLVAEIEAAWNDGVAQATARTDRRRGKKSDTEPPPSGA